MLKLCSSCMLPFVKHVLGGKTCDQTWICTVWLKCHLSVCAGRWILCTMCLEAMHTDKQLVCKRVLGKKDGGGSERQIYFHEGKLRKSLRTATSSCVCKPAGGRSGNVATNYRTKWFSSAEVLISLWRCVLLLFIQLMHRHEDTYTARCVSSSMIFLHKSVVFN